jgi:hypothetical protein
MLRVQESERHLSKCQYRPPTDSYHPLPIHLVRYASELGLEDVTDQDLDALAYNRMCGVNRFLADGELRWVASKASVKNNGP